MVQKNRSSFLQFVFRVCLVSNFKWALPLSLLVMAAAYELLSFRMMFSLSVFYNAVIDRDIGAFGEATLWASITIILTVIVKSCRSFLCDACALEWRSSIAIWFQKNYVGSDIYRSLSSNLDNVDQRLTQDIEELTSKFAVLINDIALTPVIIVFYIGYLVLNLGWIAPTICIAYFVIGSVLSAWLARLLVSLTYNQEKCEGNLRASHISILSFFESIFFLGGLQLEIKCLQSVFSTIVSNKSLLIMQQFKVNVFSNWFASMGAIVNYAAVGASLFYENSLYISNSQIVAKFTTGSYACLYLVHAFSVLVDATRTVSELLGLSRRVSELFEQLLDFREQQSAVDHRSCHDNDIWESYKNDSSSSVWLSKLRLWAACYHDRWSPVLFHRLAVKMPFHSAASTHHHSYSSVVASSEDVVDTNDAIALVHVRSIAGSHSNASNCVSRNTGILPETSMEGFISDGNSSAVRREVGLLVAPTAATTTNERLLALSAVNIYAAAQRLSGRVLIKSLSVDIYRGMKILVTGLSGCGKSSFLKTLMESFIQRWRSQRISAEYNHATRFVVEEEDDDSKRRRSDGISFLSPALVVALCEQSPFMPQGNLVNNILYPCRLSDVASVTDIITQSHDDSGYFRDRVSEYVLSTANESSANRTGGDSSNVDGGGDKSMIDATANLEIIAAQCQALQRQLLQILTDVHLPQFIQTIKDDIQEEMGIQSLQSNKLYSTDQPSDIDENVSKYALTESLISSRYSGNGTSTGSIAAAHENTTKNSQRRWRHEISLGEQQRIAVARVLLKNPGLALFDEVTSALDEETEVEVYMAIRKRCDTFISVGHRSSIRRFHTHELHIQTDGGWTLTTLPPS